MASFNGVGNEAAMFCKKYAEDRMVNVHKVQCSQDSCTKYRDFDVEGRKAPAYCKPHADADVVNARKQYCSLDSCVKHPSFNVVGGSMTAVFYRQHAGDGMVNVRSRRHCSHDSCMKIPSFIVGGSRTPVFCKQHVKDGMVDVHTKRCFHGFCEKAPSFCAPCSTNPVYCNQHAGQDVVSVRVGRSLKNSRANGPARGCETNVGASTVGPRPEGAGLETSVMNCRKRSSLKADEKRPPHNHDRVTSSERSVVQTVAVNATRKRFPTYHVLLLYGDTPTTPTPLSERPPR